MFTKVIRKKNNANIIDYNSLPAFQVEIILNQDAKIGEVVKEIQNKKDKFIGKKAELAFTGKAQEFLEDNNEMIKTFFSYLFCLYFL